MWVCRVLSYAVTLMCWIMDAAKGVCLITNIEWDRNARFPANQRKKGRIKAGGHSRQGHDMFRACVCSSRACHCCRQFNILKKPSDLHGNSTLLQISLNPHFLFHSKQMQTFPIAQRSYITLFDSALVLLEELISYPICSSCTETYTRST